jgi:peptidoglycan/LPS O-acetylase OafA/YrhL
MSRLPDFDGLRFLLCIGIAVFHFSFRIPVKNEALNEFILAFSYFTDIFFIVSGLFLARGETISGTGPVMLPLSENGWRGFIRCTCLLFPVSRCCPSSRQRESCIPWAIPVQAGLMG